jgi:hypothetical protein
MMQAVLFRRELLRRFKADEALGAPTVDINAGDIHRAVGGHPGSDHRMATCCGVIYAEQGPNDQIIAQPPKRKEMTRLSRV